MDPQTNLGPNPPQIPPQSPVVSLGVPGNQSAPGAVPPIAPPPSAASWLPPSVPVQSGSAASHGDSSGGAANAAPVSIPDSADDTDLIEKEWVLGAKQIVEQTKHDPYKQTKEMHKLKAEYMKKRYNKIIQPVEE